MDKDKLKEFMDSMIKELYEKIKNGESDDYKRYLEMKAQFHKYSFGNCILIWFQKPNASMVAGFEQWKKMGYYVEKGATGIAILAPQMRTYILRRNKEGKDEKIFWRDMTDAERQSTNKHETLVGFRTVYVFDVSDTTAKDNPDFKFFKNLGDSHSEVYEKLCRILRENGIDVKEEDCEGQGYYMKGTDYIVVNETIDDNNKVIVLIHELGHLKLHKIEGYDEKYSRTDAELQAESISYVVSQFLGVEHPFAADYIINWRGTPEKFVDNIQVISQVSTEITELIEKSESILLQVA